MAANQALLDVTIRHAVFLERLKAGEVAKFAPFLKQIDRSLRERLNKAPLTDYNTKRLTKMLSDVDSLLLAIFSEYSDQLKLDLIDLATYEAQFEATSLTKAAPATVSFEAAVPTVSAIRAAVLGNPLSIRGPDGGKLLEPFIKDWTAAERTRLTGAIRQGFFEGQTNAEIIQKIRGTKALKYSDGLLAVTDRNATTVVRTAIQHVASQARMETAKANSDVVLKIELVATLDSKTSQICRTLDGKVFPIDSGPRPPFHPNCRTTFVMKTRLSEMFSQGATRAAVGAEGAGQVSADLSYYQWLQAQPDSFVQKALGPARAKLFKSGGLSVKRFSELQLDRQFKPLNLEQMKLLEPLAFERAGI